LNRWETRSGSHRQAGFGAGKPHRGHRPRIPAPKRGTLTSFLKVNSGRENRLVGGRRPRAVNRLSRVHRRYQPYSFAPCGCCEQGFLEPLLRLSTPLRDGRARVFALSRKVRTLSPGSHFLEGKAGGFCPFSNSSSLDITTHMTHMSSSNVLDLVCTSKTFPLFVETNIPDSLDAEQIRGESPPPNRREALGR